MLEMNELMVSFVEDCREHLGQIETSLMDMEAAGAALDLELVNSVFRAAHSIKGGAGMLGLDNIKLLSHKLENVLHMVRNAELVPTSDVVSVLLMGFDRLTELVENVDASEGMPIEEQVQSLMLISAGDAGGDEVTKEPTSIDVGKTSLFTVDPLSLDQARSGGNYIYLLEYDLIHDIHGKNKMPFEMLKQLTDTGRIVDCKVDFDAVGDLDGFGNSIPFYVLFASILEPKYVSGLVKLPPERVRNIEDVPEAVSVRALESFREEFGCAVLAVSQGQGVITVPKELNSRALQNVKAALLAALARCDTLSLDMQAVHQCDIMFYQMVCSAHYTFRNQGKRLHLSQSIPVDCLGAARSLGFGCADIAGCPFGG